MNNKFIHAVRTYDMNGKMLYEEHFETAEKAYYEYVAIIKYIKNYGVPGISVIVARFRNDMVMTMETVKS